MNGRPGDRVVEEVDDGTVMVDELDDGTVMVDEPDELDDGTVMVDEVDDGTVVVDEPDELDDGTVMVDEVDDGTVMVDDPDELDDGTVVVVDEVNDATVLVDRRTGRRASALAEPVVVAVRRERSKRAPVELPRDPWAPPASDGPSTRVERERYAPRPVPPAPPAVVIPDGAAPLRQAAPQMPSVARSTRRWARVAVVVWVAVTLTCCTAALLLARVILG